MFWWITLLFLWSNECCQFDLWFLCLFFFSFAFSTPISFCRDLLNPGTEPVFTVSLALQGDSLLLEPLGKLCTHGPLPFLNPASTSGSSPFTHCWSLTWKIFEHYFARMWDECNCVEVWTFFGIAFLWDWNENWPFLVLWPLLSFPNLLAYWVQLFQSIIF